MNSLIKTAKKITPSFQKIKEKIKEIKEKIVKFFPTNTDLSMSALDISIDTVVGNEIPGDYLEFGVYKGNSFIRSYKRFKRIDQKHFKKRSFIAFDSFEGLPDTEEKFLPSHFRAGAYNAEENVFIKNLKKNNVDINKIKTVAGFYNKTLTPKAKILEEVQKAAVIYIDVDLYESAKHVFSFITDLVDTGSIIVIDDWFRHRGVPQFGIQKACYEWLDENKNIELILLHQWRRIAFIVNKKNEAETN